MDGPHQAGQVDDAEQTPCVGIEHGRGGARPALDDLVEVLGREDLDRVLGGERGADGVCPRAALRPHGALGEVHRVGGVEAQLGTAVDPQQQAGGVADDDQVVALLGERPQAAADERRRGRQRMDVPARGDLVGVGDDRGDEGG